MSVPIRLPKRRHIQPTNDEDPLTFYYWPVVGAVYRQRLAMACEAMGRGPFERVLDAGYGSGILLPELFTRAQWVYGLDLHDQMEVVHQMLKNEGARATLLQGSVLKIPLPDKHLDAAICLSVMEHLNADELPKALCEFARVAKKDARLIFGFPVRNTLTDFLFRTLGFRPREIHPSSHRDILKAIPEHLTLEKTTHWPAGVPMDLSLYVVCTCRA